MKFSFNQNNQLNDQENIFLGNGPKSKRIPLRDIYEREYQKDIKIIKENR